MNNDDSLVVLLGDRHYQVKRPWGDLPADQAFGFISQLALDSAGRVYVFQRGQPPVLVFEPTGSFRSAWGHDYIVDAHGIFISSSDQVFLVDRDSHQILIFTIDGTLVGSLGERNVPRFQAPFNHPTNVAVARDGDIYVSDGYGNSTVHRFSSAGEYRQTWGRPGVGPGEFSTPHSICVDQHERVLVVDRENNRVQIFDRDGKYLDEWGDFYHPMDIYEDNSGMLYITDQIPRLSMMSPEGKLLGRCRPVLNMPHGISGNNQGDLFLAEMNPTRVTKLALLA